VSSPVRQASSSGKSVTWFPDVPNRKGNLESSGVRRTGGLTAFSFEFVAKPEQAANAVSNLPAAIHSGLEDVAGFAGSLVMVSDQEARLITVMIFWQGSEAQKSCAQSLRRVRALLAPYLDRCLRVQNMLVHLPMPQDSQASSIDTHFIARESVAEEANVCMA
jgi:hypothetical protein